MLISLIEFWFLQQNESIRPKKIDWVSTHKKFNEWTSDWVWEMGEIFDLARI